MNVADVPRLGSEAKFVDRGSGIRIGTAQIVILAHPGQIFGNDEGRPAHPAFNFLPAATDQAGEIGVGQHDGGILGDEDGGVSRVFEDGAVALLVAARPAGQRLFFALQIADVIFKFGSGRLAVHFLLRRNSFRLYHRRVTDESSS